LKQWLVHVRVFVYLLDDNAHVLADARQRGGHTNTAAATLRGNLSMASARLRPPWLWLTGISLSPSGAAATASSSGRE